MSEDEERSILCRFSSGEIDRRTLQIELDREIDFADTLRLLHRYALKLPRVRSNPDAPGLKLLRDQIRRAAHG